MTRPFRRLAHVLAAAALAAGALVALGAAPASAAGPLGYMIGQGESDCWLASVDLVTGETTQIGGASPAHCAFDLEFTPDGTRLLGTHFEEGEGAGVATLVEFDLTTGTVTTLSQLGDFPVSGPGPTQGNLTFSTSGGLFTYLVPEPEEPAAPEVPAPAAVDPACDGSAFCLFQVDQADPTQLTYVNHVPQTFTVYFGLATSCAGTTSSAYEEFVDVGGAGGWTGGPSAAQPGGQTLASVNLTSTGPATTDVGPIPNAFLFSMDYDTAGTLYGVGYDEVAGAALFTVNPATAQATLVQPLNDGDAPIDIGVLGFAIAHPCTAPPPAPPAAQPIAVVAPRFTG